MKRPGDPFGRELAEIRREAELAARVMEQLDEAIATARRLKLGREAGPRLWRRLEVSRDVFARMADRDRAIAAELELQERDPSAWFAARQGGTRLVVR
jgi:hypothetical protein